MVVLTINWNTQGGVALILAMIALAIVAIALFVVWSRSGPQPLDDFRDIREMGDAVDSLRTAANKKSAGASEDREALNRAANCVRDEGLTPLIELVCPGDEQEESIRRRRTRQGRGFHFTLLHLGSDPCAHDHPCGGREEEADEPVQAAQ